MQEQVTKQEKFYLWAGIDTRQRDKVQLNPCSVCTLKGYCEKYNFFETCHAKD